MPMKPRNRPYEPGSQATKSFTCLKPVLIVSSLLLLFLPHIATSSPSIFTLLIRQAHSLICLLIYSMFFPLLPFICFFSFPYTPILFLSFSFLPLLTSPFLHLLSLFFLPIGGFSSNYSKSDKFLLTIYILKYPNKEGRILCKNYLAQLLETHVRGLINKYWNWFYKKKTTIHISLVFNLL